MRNSFASYQPYKGDPANWDALGVPQVDRDMVSAMDLPEYTEDLTQRSQRAREAYHARRAVTV